MAVSLRQKYFWSFTYRRGVVLCSDLSHPLSFSYRGDSWKFYNEYYQWVPSHNENSQQFSVSPGEEHFGSITYNPATHSYTIFHNVTSGKSVSTPIKIQKDSHGNYKNYSIFYAVWEKDAPCSDYPPDEVSMTASCHTQFLTFSPPSLSYTHKYTLKHIHPHIKNR